MSGQKRERVFVVDGCGQARAVDAAEVRTEAWRIGEAMAQGAVASGCSDQILVAPARGAVAEFREGYWLGEGRSAEWRDMPYKAGCPGRTRDVFDDMTDQATRRGGAAPFTAGQVGAGRDYRDLRQRVESAGLKASSAFDDRVRGQGKVDFLEVYMDDAARLARFDAAIGDGFAMTVRGNGAHSMDRGTRRSITVRRIVEIVCLSDKPLSRVLMAHGWSASSKNIKAVRDALCAALGRMRHA